jgi:anti-anti-sigma factor
MSFRGQLFEVEQTGPTLTITLRRGGYGIGVDAEVRAVRAHAESESTKNVVVDLRKLEYLATPLLQQLILIQKTIDSKGGRMAICNASDHLEEVLMVVKLDTFWVICNSREEAIKEVEKSDE